MDDAIAESPDRLAALDRPSSDWRTAATAVRCGAESDPRRQRLEADPAAELTVEEAAAQEAADH